MFKLVVVFHGDNAALHREALEAAVAAAEKVNKAPAYRAWTEHVEPGAYMPQGIRLPRSVA